MTKKHTKRIKDVDLLLRKKFKKETLYQGGLYNEKMEKSSSNVHGGRHDVFHDSMWFW